MTIVKKIRWIKELLVKKVYASRSISFLLCLLYSNQPAFRRKHRANLFIRTNKQIVRNRVTGRRVIENGLYGHEKIFSNYANQKPTGDSLIEHGLFFGGYIPYYYEVFYSAKFITISKKRECYLRETLRDGSFVSVGPYIQYAPQFYSENQLQRIKNKFGKILLIFLPHSDGNYIITSHTELQVDQFQNDFDKILICAYWRDYSAAQVQVARINSRKVSVVTAGSIFDYDFLPRLKSFLWLADYSVSFEVGTHVGYCIAEDVPHAIIPWEISRKANFENKRLSSIRDEAWSEKQEVLCHFKFNDLSGIKSSQKELVDKYWGLSQRLSPEEMSMVLKM